MRVPISLVLLVLTACSDSVSSDETTPPARRKPPLTQSEERAIIASGGEAGAVLRSGPRVPAQLPPGFSIYPGADVISNTIVERGGQTRSLVVMETAEPIAAVMTFYRGQARVAGLDAQIDLGGEARASIGGHLKGGGEIAISARRVGGRSVVELASLHRL